MGSLSSLSYSSRVRLRTMLASVLAWLCLTALHAGAQETPSLVVTTTADVVDDTDNQTSLREALTYAATLTGPQTITFADATVAGAAVNFYDGTAHTITLGGAELDIDSAVTLTGPGAKVLTIDAAQQSRVFNIGSVTPAIDVALSGVTLADGNDTSRNGGSGIDNQSTGALTLTDCALSGNSISNGVGGGIFNGSTGAVTLTNCTLSGNSVGFGGGIYNYSTGAVTLTNCTLSGNIASNNGGGIYNYSTGPVTLTNCTLSGNSATGLGGGVYNQYTGTVTLTNTIDADSNSGTLTSGGNNLISVGAAGFTNGTNGDIVGSSGSPVNAMLGPLADNGGPTLTMALYPGSPALDAGDNAEAVDENSQPLTTDQRGLARVVNGTVDIGAYEAAPSLIVTNTNDSGPGSLREVVKDVAPGGTVTFSDGSNGTTDFQGTNTITLTTGSVSITQSLTITGPGAGKLTVDGNQGGQIFGVSPYLAATISGLTMINANPGAIYNDGSLTVNDCVITGNGSSTAQGGAIYNFGYFNAGVEVNRCTISGNTAGQGGAIYSYGFNYPSVTIRDSTISGNTATDGGAIFNDGQTGGAGVTIISSTVAGNSASHSGGAIYNNASGGGAGVTIANSTIAGNTATTSGGTIYNDGSGGSATVYLRDTILAKGATGANYASANGATATSNGYNIVDDTSAAAFLKAAGDQSNKDPKLQRDANDATKYALANNGGPTQTIALLSNSPALDAGIDVATLVGDIDDVTTSVQVSDGTYFPVGSVLLIDDEEMSVTAASGGSLTVTRGVNSTTAALHSNGVGVDPAFDQRGDGFPRVVHGSTREIPARIDIGAFEGPYQAPIPISDDTAFASGRKAIDIDVLANDGGSGFTLSIVTPPLHGTATVVNGKIHYVPKGPLPKGGDTFTYSNGKGTATVTIVNFSAVAGTYEGPIGDDTAATPGLAHEHAGYLRMTISSKGSFSGLLNFAGFGLTAIARGGVHGYRFAGGLDSTGTSLRTVLRHPRSPLAVTLALDPVKKVIGGTVKSTDSTSSAFTSTLTLAPHMAAGKLAGRYTLRIEPDATPNSPQGDGYAAVHILASGRVTAAGKLADGTPFTRSMALDPDSAFSLYVPLYGAAFGTRGSLRGTVQFGMVPSGVADGTLDWYKPAAAGGQYFPAGLGLSRNAVLASYQRPRGAGILSFSQGQVLLANGGFATVNQPIKLALNSSVQPVPPNPQKVSLHFNLVTGLISGRFVNPANGKATLFQGAVFQDESVGLGYFLGAGATDAGSVLIEAQVP